MKSLIPQPNLFAGKPSPAALPGAARGSKPLRIRIPILPPRPVFAGNPKFLRALRAAEMAMWQATGGDYFRSPAAN